MGLEGHIHVIAPLPQQQQKKNIQRVYVIEYKRINFNSKNQKLLKLTYFIIVILKIELLLYFT